MSRLGVHHLVLAHEPEADDQDRELLARALLLGHHLRQLVGRDEAFGDQEVGEASPLGVAVSVAMAGAAVFDAPLSLL